MSCSRWHDPTKPPLVAYDQDNPPPPKPLNRPPTGFRRFEDPVVAFVALLAVAFAVAFVGGFAFGHFVLS